MNGVFDKQTSGNDWTPVIHSMLHQREQEQLPKQQLEQQRIVLDDLEQQMARYEADHQAMLGEVARCYVMPKDNSVRRFLNAHRALASILLQALPRLRDQFGDTVFALRQTSDEDGWQNLCIDAIWSGNAAEAYAAIDRFEDAWWVANSHMGAGRLIFTYRLV